MSNLNLKKVINASGKMTILGGSTVNSEIFPFMNEALNSYVEMKELYKESGRYIASRLNAEDGHITSSASAALALTVASLISKDNIYGIEKLYKYAQNKPREVVIQKGHNVNYGAPVETMVNLGGGELVEAGYSNECTLDHLRGVITENTIALIYVKSHHAVQKHMVSLEDMRALSKEYNLPLIIDAAAEENLKKYITLGDIVIYSGTKAIEGPTSGLILGKKNLIENIRLQNLGIGRAMKIGRENIIGVVKALEFYLDKGIKYEVYKEDIENFCHEINKLENVKGRVVQDESGREIYRAELDFGNLGEKVNDLLKNGEVAIYTRDYYANLGRLQIDPRPLKKEDLNTILTRIKEILKGE